MAAFWGFVKIYGILSAMTNKRPDYSGLVVHAMNRRVDRQTLFRCEDDYSEFRSLLGVAINMFELRLLEWVLMPNHFHFLAWPETKEQLSEFMGWLCGTHAKKWRSETDTRGEGAVYQDRYKAFIVRPGPKLHRLRNYLAMNPVKAGLVKHPWEWNWGSAKRAKYKSFTSDIKLSDGPEPHHLDLSKLLLLPLDCTYYEEKQLQLSLKRETPFGEDEWRELMIIEHGLEHTLRKPGRPPDISKFVPCNDQLWILGN